MYVKRPLIMKYPMTVPEKDGLKKSIDQFLDLIVSSERNSFKADADFGFSLEDFRFEIYNPELGLFHDHEKDVKKDLIGSIDDPMHSCKIAGSSVNTDTFANHLRDVIAEYEPRLRDVGVNTEFFANGSILIVAVKGIINDGYDTPYTYYSKIRIW